MELLTQVRETAKAVTEKADHVSINYLQVPAYAASVPVEQIKTVKPHPSYHYYGDPEDTLAFFITLNAINFGSGYSTYIKKQASGSIYYTIALGLKKYFEIHGVATARDLTQLTTQDCARLFSQDAENPIQGELMSLFSTALNELGYYLLDRFDGDFSRMVAAADHSVEKFIHLLSEMPAYRDVADYKGIQVAFYKRAQITAADLALAFEQQGPGLFYDLESLTIFADNDIPRVLYADRILIYDQLLASLVNSEEPIPAGSNLEVEIRATAVHAAELIVRELRNQGKAITAMELDQYLWGLGQTPPYQSIKPHRTRTIYY